MGKSRLVALLASWLAAWPALPAMADPASWSLEWPRTDVSRSLVELDEIVSGGPPRDGIPAIDAPAFAAAGSVDLPLREAVIGLTLKGRARAYPLRILMWHEIVNDDFAGQPIVVTFCPLFNTAIVFERTIDGRVLDFGTTGKLRHSDLVMYDRQTESWWQQFTGEAIVGELAGKRLAMLPARLESYGRFLERTAGLPSEVLVPAGDVRRDYGRNPYVGYDDLERLPFLFRGELPGELPAMARVVRVGDRAWSVDLLRQRGSIETDELRLEWTAGQVSALDSARLAEGREVGNIVVERRTDTGWQEAVYSVDFAFAFRAFFPESAILTE